MHLRPRSVQPVDRLAKPCYSNAKANNSIRLPSGESALNHDKDKVVTASKPCSTKKTTKTNDVPYRTRSGREICKPSHYRE